MKYYPRLLLIIVALGFTQILQGQVSILQSQLYTQASSTGWTRNLDLNAAEDTVVFVSVNFNVAGDASPTSINSVTLGGQAMTLVGSALSRAGGTTNEPYVNVYRLANPVTSSLSVSFGSAVAGTVSFAQVSGLNLSNPVASSGTNASPLSGFANSSTIGLTTTQANQPILSFLGTQTLSSADYFVAGSTLAQVLALPGNGHAIGSTVVSSAGDFDATIVWSGNQRRYAQVGMVLNPIPEPSTYAMLLGLAVLGFAWWQRRHRVKAI